MKSLYYWKDWNPTFKIIFWVLIILFFAQALTVLAVEVIGTDNLIEWHVLTRESSFPVDFKTVTKGFFDFTISTEKKVLTEVYSGGEVPTADYSYPVLMSIILAALFLYSGFVTMLKRFWYLVAMAGMLAFLVMMHVEMLELFGWSDTKVLGLIFIILLIPSYYLHAYNTNASFLKRLWIMGISFLVIAGVVYFFSEADQPFNRLFVYGSLAPYILMILFVLTVAHEIIALFATVITSTTGIDNRSKVRHFLILSFIYWIYILLSYLETAHYIDWEIFYVNPYFLLITSAILSVWGSRARAELYSAASNKVPIWPILHLIIAVVSLGMIILYMISVNDPILRVLKDFIIYSHLGIGIAFILYILYNFIPLMEKGYNLSKILYKPTNLPYLTYRLMALLIFVGLFAIKGFQYPVWYSLGGYDNLKADYALANGDIELAVAYYKNGNIYAYHNHKSNYAIALLEEEKNPDEAISRYALATEQQPKGQTFVNKALLEGMNRDVYTALFTLQEGAEVLKDNSYITNNLAIQFDKVKVADSALYYLRSMGTDNGKVINNLLALSAKYAIPLGPDSVNLFKNLDRAGRSNASALGVKSNVIMENADHMFDMVLLNNLLLDGDFHLEDSSLYRAREIIENTTNQDYKDRLFFNWALAAYQAGNTSQALEVLASLSFNSTNLSQSAKIVTGNLYLDLNAFEQAEEMFASLQDSSFLLQMAVARLETGYFENDAEFWLSKMNSKTEWEKELATVIYNVIYNEKPLLDTDVKRYVYGRYRRFYIDASAENDLLSQIQDNNLRIDLALYLANNYYQYGNKTGTSLMLKNIEDLSLERDQYKDYLILSALNSEDDELVQNIIVEYDSMIGFTPHDYILENTLNHKAGLTLDSIDYVQMAEANPFFADAVLIGTSQLENEDDLLPTYTYLAKAVQTNLSSPKLLSAYILKALDVGLDQFAENALFQYRQRFSGQSYLILKAEYDKKMLEQNNLLDLEPEE